MRLLHHEREARAAARSDEFRRGMLSEPAYRASLFALGYRGDDIEMDVRKHAPTLQVPAWVGVVARAIALKAIQNKQMSLAEWERFVATLWKDNACAR